MTNLTNPHMTAPFAPKLLVRKKGTIDEGAAVLRIMLDREGRWLIQVAGISFGEHGWVCADDYEPANPKKIRTRLSIGRYVDAA